MNRQSIPWIRSWETKQAEQPVQDDPTSLLVNCILFLAFVAVCWGCAVIVADGLDRSAVIAEREAKAKQRGRVEMLQEVNAVFEQEGRTLETYYRWASKKGTTGFDGLVLAENNKGGN